MHLSKRVAIVKFALAESEGIKAIGLIEAKINGVIDHLTKKVNQSPDVKPLIAGVVEKLQSMVKENGYIDTIKNDISNKSVNANTLSFLNVVRNNILEIGAILGGLHGNYVQIMRSIGSSISPVVNLVEEYLDSVRGSSRVTMASVLSKRELFSRFLVQ